MGFPVGYAKYMTNPKSSGKKAKKQHQHKLAKPRLCIKQLSLFVHLGRSLAERRTLQEIRFSIEMEFPEAPKAEATDSLKDTLCYKEVCETLRIFVKDRQFHLIEKLAGKSLSVLHKTYPSILFRLTLHKTSPPVKGLKGGVSYTCGDIFSNEVYYTGRV